MSTLPSSEQDGQAVLRLPERLDQNDWLALRDQVHRQFIDRGIIHLVIDCEAAGDLPSIAFGTLTSLSRDFRRLQGSLHLVHVSERIRKVLTRTRMDEFLPIHGTLTEVIRKRPPKPAE